MSGLKKIATLNITEVAKLKNVSRQTVYNNIDKLDRHWKRVIWNKKLENWKPRQPKIEIISETKKRNKMSALDKIMDYLNSDETNKFLTTSVEVGDILYQRANKCFVVAVPNGKAIINHYARLVNIDYVKGNGSEFIHTKSNTFRKFKRYFDAKHFAVNLPTKTKG